MSNSTITAPPVNNTNATTERERIRAEFYATYDVMTGIRTAATLGGFFLFMVIIVFCKSRSKYVKALNDPKLVQLAEAVVAEEVAAEEEFHMNAVLEDVLAEKVREKRDSFCELPSWPRSSRHSSIGSGYIGLISTPRRASSVRGDSLPTASLRFHPDEIIRRKFSRDRRLSSVTCSSSGSSYLERRGSSLVSGLMERRLSPCPSEHEAEGIAPLASIGSADVSFEVESGTVSPDSVFVVGSVPSSDDEIEPSLPEYGDKKRNEHKRQNNNGTELILYNPIVGHNKLNCNNSRETLF